MIPHKSLGGLAYQTRDEQHWNNLHLFSTMGLTRSETKKKWVLFIVRRQTCMTIVRMWRKLVQHIHMYRCNPKFWPTQDQMCDGSERYKFNAASGVRIARLAPTIPQVLWTSPSSTAPLLIRRTLSQKD